MQLAHKRGKRKLQNLEKHWIFRCWRLWYRKTKI